MKYGHGSLFAGLLFFPAVGAYAAGVSENIYQAALAQDTNSIVSYLNSGISIDTAGADGQTPLCMAYADGQWQAYDLLLQYGANPNAPCIGQKSSSYKKYVWAGAGVAAVAGGVALIASSGGGSSSSSSDTSSTSTTDNNIDKNSGSNSGNVDNNNNNSAGNNNGSAGNDNNSGNNTGNNDNNSGNDNNVDNNSGNNSAGNEGSGSGGGGSGSGSGDSTFGGGSDGAGGNDVLKDVTYFKVADFESAGGVAYDEYWGTSALYTTNITYNDVTKTGKEWMDEGVTVSEGGFLRSINAAQAYSKIYGYDADNNVVLLGRDAEGNVVDRSHERNIVAVYDTGVDVDHPEFTDVNGRNKVFGKNYDYGPCRNGDTTNCWTYNTIKDRAELYGDTPGQVVYIANDYDETTFAEKSAYYKDDYDRDALLYDPDPVSGMVMESLSTSSTLAHGSHVAGIIGASWNQSNVGMMGVAFANTDIYSIRRTFSGAGIGVIPLYAPIQDIIKSGAIAMNTSFGEPANEQDNAATAADFFGTRSKSPSYPTMAKDLLDANKYTINPITGNTAIDGVIWVDSAGNNGYIEPDPEAGIKNLSNFTFVDYHKLGDDFYSLSEEAQNERKEAAKVTVDFSNLLTLVVVNANVMVKADGTLDYFTIRSSSNRCGSTAAYCIAAPGRSAIYMNDETRRFFGINSTIPLEQIEGAGYYRMEGTSMAAPVVTGSIALLKSAYPFLHSSDIIEILLSTANKTQGRDITEGYPPISGDSEQFRQTFGAGLLDIGRAVSEYLAPGSGVSTLSGTSVESSYVYMGNANLTVSPSMVDTVMEALPETITLFDRYYRPFDVSTANYVSVTHAGYKNLKNDVAYIVPNTGIKHKKEGNLSFSYAEAPMSANTNGGLGFMDTEYKVDNISGGFFFSENSRYTSDDTGTADLSNPFMSFNSMYGARVGYDITPKYGFKLHAASGRNGLYYGDEDFDDKKFTKPAYAISSELTFKPSRKVSMAVMAGMLHEDEALLGLTGFGSFGLPESKTYFTGVRTSYSVTRKLTLSGSYYQGWTDAQSFNSNMLHTSRLISNSFAFDTNYKWNKTTNFGFRISSPLRIEHGKLRVDMASGRDYYSDTVYRNQYAASMKPDRREYKFAVYCNKNISDNLSISSEFDVRVNPEHRAASNDYRALFGLAWNF